jgi:hypothetical protein
MWTLGWMLNTDDTATFSGVALDVNCRLYSFLGVRRRYRKLA